MELIFRSNSSEHNSKNSKIIYPKFIVIFVGNLFQTGLIQMKTCSYPSLKSISVQEYTFVPHSISLN